MNFPEDYILASKGCCLLEFLHAPENDQSFLTPKLSFQSDLRHRAASMWVLPHISSCN